MRKVFILWGILGFIVAYRHRFNEPIRVLLLGYNGAGKSTIVNVLGGLTTDAKEIAPTGSSSFSFTKECEKYYLTHEGRSLYVVDTPGFGPDEEWNTKLRKQIATDVPRLLFGFDALIFVIPVEKIRERDLVWIDFFNSYIDQEKLIAGKLSQGIIVFTYADDIPMDPKFENELISQALIKTMMTKFIFYRHESGNKNGIRLGPSELRTAFRKQVCTDLIELFEFNDWKHYDTDEMIKTTEKFEYQKLKSEEYRKLREELEKSFMRIKHFSERVSTDLRVKVNKVLDSAPKSFKVRRSVIQHDTLMAEQFFYENTRKLREYVQEHDFLKRQLGMMSNNVTTLMNEYSIAQQEYNIEKELFISETRKITAVQFRIPFNPNRASFPVRMTKAFSFNTVPVYYRAVQENVQHELDLVPDYYIEKFMSRAGFSNDNFRQQSYRNTRPTFNEYLDRIQVLKEKTASVYRRIKEIKQLREEMKNSVFLFKDYEHKEIILELGERVFTTSQIRQEILNSKVVYMNESQREANASRYFI
ncbi:hypothetical protein O9G_000758 [Rozella allomycis CSF55]|uniref:AIG1-type G domain-containing protein n=1 Tax=Rozella allomycis (strain CSF55) TaxID=988480 RepID=A0A075AYK0_ROZAC|nr:hypothetical protein O9G_000758 [Rozella allomycis CSF55]|eukprot:EPZ35362.1 hypothetical protein O9G_000758 [Rozella allomycis CSF55]